MMPTRIVVRARRGFTLIEMMIALVLLGLVGGAIVTAIAGHQRFFRGASDIMQARGQLRQAMAMLTGDLRAISRRDADIYELTNQSIDFRGVTGSSFICAKPTNTTFVIPPLNVKKNNSPTAWVNQPQAGDSMFVYDDSAAASTSDDAWRVYQIASIDEVVGVNGCPTYTPTTGGFVEASDATQPSYRLTVSGGTPLRSSIGVGAPIRFFRRVKYALYEESADGNWYLGTRDCAELVSRSGTPCTGMRALAGPLRPPIGTTDTSGLRFQIYDTTGSTLSAANATTPARLARIRIALRAQTGRTIWVPGKARGLYADSLELHVGLRNRNRGRIT
jgi:prepilin-type N-terminal cleavage/methylation domain-containing protein